MYGYTPDEIARMSPYQQLMMLKEDESSSDTVFFRTERAYEEWLAKKNR